MNNTVLITGAVTNTGYGIAEKFASEGWDVIITSRSADKAAEAEKKLSEKFPEVKIRGTGLVLVNDGNSVNEEGISSLFSALDAEGVTVNALVLNAANLGIRQQIFKNPLSDFNNVLQTNVVANYAIIEQATKRMVDAEIPGSVVFINSNTAYRAIPDRIAYTTSKSAQLGMMRALAFDLGKYDIRVNAVLPGMIMTDRWDNNYNDCRHALSVYSPLGGTKGIGASFGDIAAAAWFLTVNAPFTTGAELSVDGGNMIQLYPIIPKE